MGIQRRCLIIVIGLGLLGCQSTGVAPGPFPGARGPDVSASCGAQPSAGSCFFKKDPTGTRTRLIVFVHGVFGDAASTWGPSDTDRFWPRMVAEDERFSEFDIYLVTYRTPITGSALTSTRSRRMNSQG